MDEQQIYDEADRYLHAIMVAFPNEEVSLFAGSMTLLIRPDFLEIESKSMERPSKEQLELALNEAPERFAQAAAKAVEKRNPAYQTPVFKCLEDFEKCKKHNSRSLCMALFSICVGKQLIPFTN